MGTWESQEVHSSMLPQKQVMFTFLVTTTLLCVCKIVYDYIIPFGDKIIS